MLAVMYGCFSPMQESIQRQLNEFAGQLMVDETYTPVRSPSLSSVFSNTPSLSSRSSKP